jgi:hypothetical protein
MCLPLTPLLVFSPLSCQTGLEQIGAKTIKHSITAVLGLSILAVLTAVRAQSFTDIGSFKSPSGNIFCIATRDNFQGKTTVSLSCELNQSSAKLPPKPSDCDLDWGKRFYMESRGKAIRGCHGDTIQNPTLPVLTYGKLWQVGGFRCDATVVRVRCINLDKRGFELSKARQVLF